MQKEGSRLIEPSFSKTIFDYYSRMRVFLRALLRAAADFFFNRTLGFSKCSRFLTSDKIPAFSQDFLNFLNAASKFSPSRTRTNATRNHLPSRMKFELMSLTKGLGEKTVLIVQGQEIHML